MDCGCPFPYDTFYTAPGLCAQAQQAAGVWAQDGDVCPCPCHVCPCPCHTVTLYAAFAARTALTCACGQDRAAWVRDALTAPDPFVAALTQPPLCRHCGMAEAEHGFHGRCETEQLRMIGAKYTP